MDLRTTQLKDTYGNLVTTGTTAGSPTTGGLQNGDGSLLTSVGIGMNDPSVELEVGGSTNTQILISSTSNTGNSQLYFGDSDSDTSGVILYRHNGDSMAFEVNNNEKMRIEGGGDISFRDGSANEAFYWDASTARLGIGNQAPTVTLDVTGDIALSNDLYISNGNFIKLQRNSGGLYLDVLGTPSGTDDVRLLTSGAFDLVNGSLTSMLKVDTSGNVGIGVSPSYPLEVDTGAGTFSVRAKGGGSVTIASDASLTYFGDTHEFSNSAGTSEFMRIDSSGNVGIGTDSPDTILDIAGTTPTLTINDTQSKSWSVGDELGGISWRTNDGSGAGAREVGFIHIEDDEAGDNTTMSGAMVFGSSAYNASATERMRIDSSGNLGIGTTSPVNVASGYTNLTINGTGASNRGGVLSVSQADTEVGRLIVFDQELALYNQTSNPLIFGTGGSEKMRIDSSGNLLVGKTASGVANDGFQAYSAGYISVTDTSFSPLILNRKTTNGDIVDFQKDGTSVGSIGSVLEDSLSRLYIAQSDTGLKFNNGPDYIVPCTSAGADRDNVIDLGSSSARFTDIYATNGTIQTSDINEKQDIEELDDAELRVAQKAKTLLRKFRWKSSVEENENARIHFGIIAQDLEQAFTDEGLDAGRYGMFIKSTWTNEEGEEQTRLGVRYNQLLAFIISAL